MNIRNNYKTYLGLEELYKKAPAQEILDEYEDAIRDLRYSTFSETGVAFMSDEDLLRLHKACGLGLQEAISSRALMLQCSISHNLRLDPSHRKDCRNLKNHLNILRAEIQKRADQAAKRARTLRAALR